MVITTAYMRLALAAVALALFTMITTCSGREHHFGLHHGGHGDAHDAAELLFRAQHTIHPRSTAATSTLPKAVLTSWEQARGPFDYIIVGGGTAGMTLAGRLSEDKDVTVLVVEAGPSGYSVDKVTAQPNAIDYDRSDLARLVQVYNTTKQEDMGHMSPTVTAARVLGGGSTVSYLRYVRHGQREAHAFTRIVKELSGGQHGWGWDHFHRKLDDSVHFDDPDKQKQSSCSKQASTTLGKSGPLFLSYPQSSSRVESLWLNAWRDVGVSPAASPHQGRLNGAFIAPVTVHQQSEQRSSARTAYFDPIANSRDNIKVLPDQTVTKIIFDAADSDGKRRALGVEYAAGDKAPRVLVTAKREVILCAGAIGSPHLLQLSGVGRGEILKRHNVDVVKDLPGVGQHLQDSVGVTVSFETKAGVTLPSHKSNKAYVDSAVAILPVSDLFASPIKANEFLERAASTTKQDERKGETTVKEGWRKTRALLTEDLLPQRSHSGLTGEAKGAVSIMMRTSHGRISLRAAIGAPFSRGSVSLKSSDPFEHPDIDPAFLDHTADQEMLLAGVASLRKLAASKSMKKFIAGESNATCDLKTDTDWARHIHNTSSSGALGMHLTSTCSMLPEAQGGVVDSDLRVYGFSNLRVVDASVIPMSPSGGTMSYVYGVAEVAAGKIKTARRNDEAEPLDECEYLEDLNENHQGDEAQTQGQQKHDKHHDEHTVHDHDRATANVHKNQASRPQPQHEHHDHHHGDSHEEEEEDECDDE